MPVAILGTDDSVDLALELDFDALAQLARQTFPLACPTAVSADDAEDFCRNHLTANHFRLWAQDPNVDLLVAVDDCAAAGNTTYRGYSLMYYRAPTDPEVVSCIGSDPCAELSKMYVHPDTHRSGIASRLIRRASDLAADRGFTRMWLGVNQDNSRARSFYRYHHFLNAGTRSFTVGHTHCRDYVMLRSINSPPGST